MASPLANGTSSCAAMALLEKYSILNRGMDQIRTERSQCHDDIENIQMQIQTARQQREDYSNDLVVAQTETAALYENISSIEQQLMETQQQLHQAREAQQQSHRYLTHLIISADEQRCIFLQSCRSFRIECKRLRFVSTTTANTTATTTSTVTTTEPESEPEPEPETMAAARVTARTVSPPRACTTAPFKLHQDDLVRAFVETNRVAQYNSNEESHRGIKNDNPKASMKTTTTNRIAPNSPHPPSTNENKQIKRKKQINNNDGDNDRDIQEAQTKVDRLKSDCQNITRLFENAQRQKTIVMDRATRRDKQRKHQRCQLERIRENVSELEMQLGQVMRDNRCQKDVHSKTERLAEGATTRRGNISRPLHHQGEGSTRTTVSETATTPPILATAARKQVMLSNNSITPSPPFISANHSSRSQHGGDNATTSTSAATRISTCLNTKRPYVKAQQKQSFHYNPYAKTTTSNISTTNSNNNSDNSNNNKIVKPYQRSINNSSTRHNHPYVATTHEDGFRTNNKSTPHQSLCESKQWSSNAVGQEQYPHLVDRIRVDRQFSTTVEIMSTREEGESNKETTPMRMSFPPTTDDDNDDDDGSSTSTGSVRYRTIRTGTISRSDKESDDDDDELLSYVAFSKRKI